MDYRYSRRDFFALSGLAIPSLGLGSSVVTAQKTDKRPALPEVTKTRKTGRLATLGRTNPKVTRFVFGSMITSDTAVIERACDLGINYFSSARDYQRGDNERLLSLTLRGKRQ